MPRTVVIKRGDGASALREFFTDEDRLDASDNFLYPFRKSEMSTWNADEFGEFFDAFRQTFPEREFHLKVAVSYDEYKLLESNLPTNGFTIEFGMDENDAEIREEKGEREVPSERKVSDESDDADDHAGVGSDHGSSSEDPRQNAPLMDGDEIQCFLEKITIGELDAGDKLIFSFDHQRLNNECSRCTHEHPDMRWFQAFFLRRQIGAANHLIYMRGIDGDGRLVCENLVATILLESSLAGEGDFRFCEFKR